MAGRRRECECDQWGCLTCMARYIQREYFKRRRQRSYFDGRRRKQSRTQVRNEILCSLGK
jgi:hypothetical protein